MHITVSLRSAGLHRPSVKVFLIEPTEATNKQANILISIWSWVFWCASEVKKSWWKVVVNTWREKPALPFTISLSLSVSLASSVSLCMKLNIEVNQHLMSPFEPPVLCPFISAPSEILSTLITIVSLCLWLHLCASELSVHWNANLLVSNFLKPTFKKIKSVEDSVIYLWIVKNYFTCVALVSWRSVFFVCLPASFSPKK